MFRFVPVIVACMTTTAVAQLNEFEVFPGNDGLGATTAYRGNFGANEGSVFQGYHERHFRGIGDDGASCKLHGFQFLVQDQNTATQDPFTLAIRTGGPFGPTPGAPGLIAGFNLLTPPGGGGSGASLMTVTPASPVTVPCDSTVLFFVGIQFPASAGWPGSDGPSIRIRNYGDDSMGTWCLVDLPPYIWQFIGNPNTPGVHPGTAGVCAIALRTPCPTLNIGALGGVISPNFGAPGMFTKVGPPLSLGITFRVRDAANPNGAAIVLFGRFFGPPFPLASLGIKGNLWMSTGLVGQLASTTLDGNGESIFNPPWMGAGMLQRYASLCGGAFCFQALTYTPPVSNVRASNGAATWPY